MAVHPGLFWSLQQERLHKAVIEEVRQLAMALSLHYEEKESVHVQALALAVALAVV